MATTSLMIQLLTEQSLDADVTDVTPLEGEAFLFLDPSRNTVLREMATEEVGGVIGSGLSDSNLTLGYSSTAFTELRLVRSRGEDDTYFYGPSFNSSPPVTGFGLAILRVTAPGFTLSGSGQLNVSRTVGAHAYVDQSD
jgi:hypothetical protein